MQVVYLDPHINLNKTESKVTKILCWDDRPSLSGFCKLLTD